jgi:signal transduction histidine kinase
LKWFQLQTDSISALILLTCLLLFAFILIRNKKKAKALLQQQKEKVESTLEELTAAKTQLEHKNRDLEIEAALEKVRSRSLAMHITEELKEVVNVVFEELQTLNITTDGGTTIATFIKNSKELTVWVADPHTSSLCLNLPYPQTDLANHSIISDFWKAKDNGIDYYAKVYSFEEKNTYFHYVFSVNEYMSDNVKNWLLERKNFAHSVVLTQNAAIALSSFTGQLLSEAEGEILSRFANVFEQAYVRFLDLQKAEAQVREAQIEAALEKVRSRSLSMHHSSELVQVVASLFDQLTELGLSFDGAGIFLFEKEKRNIQLWIATIHLPAPVRIDLPYDKEIENNVIVKDLWHAIENGEHILNRSYSGESKNDYFRYVWKYNEAKIPASVRQLHIESDSWTVSYAVEKNSIIVFDSWSGRLTSDKDFQILIRFARVFEQSYIRFLDLQKAEAQAREAQIELGLERVRARAMAMQKSDELAELVNAVFKELTKLGFNLYGCLIMIYDEQKGSTWWLTTDSDANPVGLYVKYHSYAPYEAYLNGWNERKEKWVYVLEGALKKEWDEYVFRETELSLLPDRMQQSMRSLDRVFFNVSSNSFGSLTFTSFEPISDKEFDVLLRFARVFDHTYTRFLDLQKAEAQAREAQIQLALERVRARTMAMQHSEELAEAATVLFEQFDSLGSEPERFSIATVNEKENVFEVWTTQHGGSKMDKLYKLSLDEPHVTQKLYAVWKAQTKSITIDLQGNELEEYFQFLKNAGVPVEREIFGSRRVQNAATFSKGILNIITSKPGPREMIDILERFAGVFDLTYTRFLDLQTAEAQAREAEIELALERVRARTTAMQHQDDLLDVTGLFTEQLIHLGFDLEVVNFSNGLSYGDWDLWVTLPTSETTRSTDRVIIPWFHHPFFQKTKTGLDNFKKGIDLNVAVFNKEEKDSFLDHVFSNSVLKNFPAESKTFLYSRPGFTFSTIFLKETWVSICKYDTSPFTDEQHAIVRRFVNAFGQAYTRFHDLQKAEEQAREAQIEAALERVRSRITMMQKSEELRDVIQMVFEQLRQLNFKIDSAHFNLNYKESDDYNLWSAAPGRPYPVKTYIPWFDHPAFIKAKEAKEKGLDFYTENYTQEEKNEFFEHLFKHARVISEERKKYILSGQGVATSTVLMNTISLWIMNYDGTPYSDAENEILKRFGKVFEQAYTRFLDLQKAEAQAREAQIEAALEKVRSSTMAMHKSEDLAKTAAVLFEQLNVLGNTPDRISISIIREPAGVADMWLTDQSGNEIETRFTVSLDEKTTVQKLVNGWKAGLKSMIVDLTGEELDTWLKYVRQIGLIVHDEHFRNRRVHNVAFFSHGWLNISALEPLPAETIKVLERFAAVYSLTYRRFIDLQKAEASAKEAVKQTSLDRIRADIASMRTTSDLDRITPLIWHELKIIDVPFVRCGVFIMDDDAQQIHTFLSTPDGKAIAAFHLPYRTPGNFIDIVHHWHDKKIYIDHWDKKEFESLADTLVQQTAGATREQYLNTLPEGGICLHLLPFLQGMLYVGNIKRLNDDEIKLLQSVADAFSTAYARYEDFNKLEAAKRQVEKTLVDLRQAQQQLVQSEKMASLGELTAGIAHEIQNPLNFVNNFSEVNNELIEELRSEKSKVRNERDEEWEDEILNDIYQNNEKINLHGKRADGIVKSMLQHSRASSGQKELTDINKLADEYLRLSYHGMRAKDKSSNAEFKTEFDESMGKINVVPQDIGRVLLNLYNNAFYAVNEKRKTAPEDYQPTVFICTKLISPLPGGLRGAEIRVKDNGTGIPQNIIDKVFQPFFTTKPTGQGTGLGLSLAYDIVKAHGGEIKVETKEDEGSEFIIQLPV